MSHPTDPTLAAVTAVYGPMELSDEEFYALTDRSLSPRSSGMLADKLAELGIGPSHHLLDVGCRDADHTIALSQRFGCTALGIDPVAHRIAETHYNIEIADCLWGVYQMIGKLCPTVYVLTK